MGDQDVESLQSRGGRRESCLDVFLVVSIVFLFMAVVALAAGGAVFVMEVRSKPDSPGRADERMASAEAEDVFKTQNMVYLEAKSSALKTSTMLWDTIVYGSRTTVGNNFLFNPDDNSLMPKKEGNYFIYIELNLTCTHRCEAGLLTVQLGNKLTCKVELRATTNSTPVSRKCWTVSWFDQQKLLTQMTVPAEGLKNWSLETKSSKLGMFLVD